MKTLRSNNATKPYRLSVMLMPLLTFYCGCKPITSSDVSGTYSRQASGIVDTITLSNNGIFSQIVTYTNGGRWTKTGSWVLKQQVVQLDESYSAFDFERKTVVIPPQLVGSQTLWVEKRRLV